VGQKLEYTMVRPLKHVHAQNATLLFFMPKTLQGFGNVVDVMASYIPWANVGKYIERMKNSIDVPCQFIWWRYDQLEVGP
jgi:hypothetical protein